MRLFSTFIRRLHTIYGLSSGFGRCGVSIIRVSGPLVTSIANMMIRRRIEPRKALLCNIYWPNDNEIIDQGIFILYTKPHSFTGEDCCEFQIHGSTAVQKALYKALDSLESVELAEPGEFTKRAYFNNKLDLTQIEGLADLLSAETEQQRKVALRITSGQLKKLYSNWRRDLIKCQSDIEMLIDFSEDHHIEHSNTIDSIIKRVLNLYKNMLAYLQDVDNRGQILQNGIKIAIIGAPNVGKSTLFNYLCRQNKSIVSPYSGTTRDLIESFVDINGYPVIFIDTAGIRYFGKESTLTNNDSEIIEQEGIKRSKICLENADIVIFVIDCTSKFFQQHIYPTLKENKNIKDVLPNMLDKYVQNEYNITESLYKPNIYLFNKIDQMPSPINLPVKIDNIAFVSGLTGTNMENFVTQLSANIKQKFGDLSHGNPVMHSHRQKTHIKSCLKYLEQFLYSSQNDHLNENTGLEKQLITTIPEHSLVIAARLLQRASRNLSFLAGDVQNQGISTDHILDNLFKDFCIGK